MWKQQYIFHLVHHPTMGFKLGSPWPQQFMTNDKLDHLAMGPGYKSVCYFNYSAYHMPFYLSKFRLVKARNSDISWFRVYGIRMMTVFNRCLGAQNMKTKDDFCTQISGQSVFKWRASNNLAFVCLSIQNLYQFLCCNLLLVKLLALLHILISL